MEPQDVPGVSAHYGKYKVADFEEGWIDFQSSLDDTRVVRVYRNIGDIPEEDRRFYTRVLLVHKPLRPSRKKQTVPRVIPAVGWSPIAVHDRKEP